MSRFLPRRYQNDKPQIQMAPLIDIVFLTLVFFMSMSVFAQLEAELNISIPKAKESKTDLRDPGEIIINVTKNGNVVVNQKQLSEIELGQMLQKVSALFPNQAVIIRADEETQHKHVIKVLDACAGANIWNIAFATIQEEKRK